MYTNYLTVSQLSEGNKKKKERKKEKGMARRKNTHTHTKVHIYIYIYIYATFNEDEKAGRESNNFARRTGTLRAHYQKAAHASAS